MGEKEERENATRFLYPPTSEHYNILFLSDMKLKTAFYPKNSSSCICLKGGQVRGGKSFASLFFFSFCLGGITHIRTHTQTYNIAAGKNEGTKEINKLIK